MKNFLDLISNISCSQVRCVQRFPQKGSRGSFYSDIANAFNKYLSSVFSSKVDFVAASETETVPSIFIDDLQVSLIEVETLLLKCDDSNSMGPDQVPSFVLHKASNILAPLVLELFTHILKNRTWPDVGKYRT